ncbi:MAG TPA: energy transducer TonB [Sphingomicrobium sp.]
MAYRNDIGTRDRGAAIAAVIAIHALLLLALLHLSGKIDLTDPQSALSVFDLKNVPPPPPDQRKQAQPKTLQSGSAPKNVKSQATPVAAPKPEVQTPPVPQITASETPRNGAASTQGASSVAGPGAGSGGSGSGSGSGNGSGAGDGGIAEPPHLATSVLTGRDFPQEMLDEWPGRVTIFLRLRVDARGYVAECTVDRGTGNPAIDGEVCNLAHERLRFRPALNRSGEAVAGWFGYAQPAPR